MLPPRLLVAFLKGEKKGPFRQRNAFGKGREDIFLMMGQYSTLSLLAPLLIYKQFASPFSLLLLQPRRPGQEKGIRSRRKESKSNRVADDETRDADDAPNAVGNDGQKERVKGRKERVKEGRERVCECVRKQKGAEIITITDCPPSLRAVYTADVEYERCSPLESGQRKKGSRRLFAPPPQHHNNCSAVARW